mmetsp:Transcript_98908/g.265618  ORF Transcript_98908/g.265618 Transcript_98908/m.265618 type:complete len:280 (+) Transcript_98908:679-1518(+)
MSHTISRELLDHRKPRSPLSRTTLWLRVRLALLFEDQCMLLAHEASPRSGRHLHHGVLRNRKFPCVLDWRATEVGRQQLKNGYMAHDEHGPRGHLHLNEHRLQPLQDVHVALTAGEALPERVALPLGVPIGVPLLEVALWRVVAPALHIQASAGQRALVDGIQRGRLLVVVRHVADRFDRAGHGAGEHRSGLPLLACFSPIPLRPLFDESGQRARKALSTTAEMRQQLELVSFAGSLGIHLAGPSAHQPDGPRPNVDGHHEGHDALGHPAIAVARHDLA